MANSVAKVQEAKALLDQFSLDRVMKSVWLLEQMGRASLGLRKAAN